jgi:hypothetical protein
MSFPSDAQLGDILHTVQAETGVPGIALALTQGGLRAQAAVGQAVIGGAELTPAARFEMSCLMKFFVSLVILELAGQGQIDLDAPIVRYLPELKGHDEILVRHLLSHSSGYRGLDITDMQVRWNFTGDKFVRYFADTAQSFTPGHVFNYEHSEHVILGEMLLRVTGQTARALVTQMIFTPLAITPGQAAADKQESLFVANHAFSSTTKAYAPVNIPPFSAFWSASLPDWTIAVGDVARVAEALVARSAGGDFLPHVKMAQLTQAQVAISQGQRSDPRAERIPSSFGLACAQYDDGQLGHNGSMLGQTCAVRLDLKRGAIVAVGVNAWSPHARDSVVRQVMALLEGDLPAQNGRQDFSATQLAPDLSWQDLPGVYRGSYLGEVRVTAKEDGLVFEAGPLGPRCSTFEIRPTGQGLYSIESRAPLSVSFSNIDKMPALFLGVHSYKKVG